MRTPGEERWVVEEVWGGGIEDKHLDGLVASLLRV